MQQDVLETEEVKDTRQNDEARLEIDRPLHTCDLEVLKPPETESFGRGRSAVLLIVS